MLAELGDYTLLFWTLSVIAVGVVVFFTVRFFRRLYILVEEVDAKLTQLRKFIAPHRDPGPAQTRQEKEEAKPAGHDLDYNKRYRE